MRLHEREQVVTAARIDLQQATLDWDSRHDLTDGEWVSVVTDVLSARLSSWARYQIRHERHGDYETPGGQAVREEKVP